MVRQDLGATHPGSPVVGVRHEARRQGRGLERPVAHDVLQSSPEVVDGASAEPGARTTLPGRAVVSGSDTTQSRRSSHAAPMALPSRETPVNRGRSPSRVPEALRTRRVLALTGSEIRASASKSTVKAYRIPLRSGDRDPLAGTRMCPPVVASRGWGASSLPPCAGWITGR
jgi:hypothetical protein